MRSRKWKIWAAVLTALALAIAATGAVCAYLSAQSGPVTNTFTPEQSEDPTINGYVVNVGDTGYDVYVRAAVVVTWKNSAGEILAETPSYTFTLGDGWFEHGGFYYYTDMVASGKSTTALINDPVEPTPVNGDYSLHVEVIAQTIQALGTTDATDSTYPSGKPAVTDAWEIEVNDDPTSADYRKLIDPSA